jgi:ubiquinone/menaquinone biosynthesis C-methylase UbiE
MIDLARARTEPSPTIAYRADDARALASCRDDESDGVTCHLGLMDIPDLDATLRSVQRVLKPGGWFVFVIGHPCFLAPQCWHDHRRQRANWPLYPRLPAGTLLAVA